MTKNSNNYGACGGYDFDKRMCVLIEGHTEHCLNGKPVEDCNKLKKYYKFLRNTENLITNGKGKKTIEMKV